ncbi:MAG: lysostaphin resistance A-like protein [Oligoflexales bacterium]
MRNSSLLGKILLLFYLSLSSSLAQGKDKLQHHPERKSDVLVPFLSYLFPGFGQWVEGDYGAGFVYSGVAVGSLSYSLQHTNELQRSGYSEDEINEKLTDLQSKDSVVRKIRLGSQTRDLMGGLSAYQSFRSAVKSRQVHGEYLFLTKEEKVSEIMTAPFRFEYLKRSTTYIPLGIIGAYAALVLASSDEAIAESNLRKSVFTSEDAVYVGATSYNAGVWEEAFFRGWMMPVFMESMNSELWSNVASAGIFALAHASSVPIPIAQALLGFHFGVVSQDNDWTIGEATFIHAWWDVVALAVSYNFEKIDPKQSVKPMLTLPPLLLSF